MRKKIVAGNWKMNKTSEEAKALVSEIANIYQAEISNDVEVILFPPFVFLQDAIQLSQDSKIKIGAQNCHQEKSGAFTGEISAEMLKSIGTNYVILGHSERRAYFGETEELLAKKLKIAFETSLKPIYCCGETLEERKSNRYFEVIENQITNALKDFSATEMKDIVLAYEPVWAIGTGETASPEQAQEVHQFIRNLIEKQFDLKTAQNTSILYGGSVKPSNANELFAQTDIDGGLIGGASLKARDFIEIIKAR